MSTPNMPKPELTMFGRVAAFIGLFLLVVGVFAACANMMGSSSGSGADEGYDNDNQYEAIAQCESRIESLLKSPATADFNSTASGGGTWTVRGTVDSENSFGALLRSTYQCTVVANAGGTLTTTVDSLE